MGADLLVLGSAALTGLMGSAHCAAMCGGVATSFSVRRTNCGWMQALQPNAGRLFGYALAGAAAGGLGHGIVEVAGAPQLARFARAAAGVVLIVAALRLLDIRATLPLTAAPGRLFARALSPLWRFTRAEPAGPRRFLAGMLWGWLPCGLSSTLLFAAWLQSSALDGALTMLAFGVGTLPTLVPLTWSGARIGGLLQRRGWRRAASGWLAAAGLVTVLAPWLSQVPAVHHVLGRIGCGGV